MCHNIKSNAKLDISRTKTALRESMCAYVFASCSTPVNERYRPLYDSEIYDITLKNTDGKSESFPLIGSF